MEINHIYLSEQERETEGAQEWGRAGGTERDNKREIGREAVTDKAECLTKTKAVQIPFMSKSETDIGYWSYFTLCLPDIFQTGWR